MLQHITVIGAPRVGKTTLLAALAHILGTDELRRSFGETENLARLDIRLATKRLAMITISGSFHYAGSQILATLLSGVDGIVYVCAALPTEHDSRPYDTYVHEEEKRQKFFWDMYVQEAERVGVLWDKIPWIFTLNKVDLGRSNPLLSYIPTQFHQEIIPCVATQGTGVAQLWQQIAATIAP